MKKATTYILCRRAPFPSGCTYGFLTLALLLAPGAHAPARAQNPKSPPNSAPSPSPADRATNTSRPLTPNYTLTFGDASSQAILPNGDVSATGGVELVGPDITISADRAEGNLQREVILSGNAKITTNGATSSADAIHFFPQRRAYRLDNPRAILQPSFLQNRVYDPIYLFGGELAGTRSGYALADNTIATTCIEPFHHYELRVRSAELVPGKQLTLRRVGVYLFGAKLITIPKIVIPLDQRPRRARTDYLPEFGQNQLEGYYGRFPYAFAVGAAAATFLRADLTQKKGLGYRVEQEYLAGKQESGFNTSGAGYGGGSGFNLGALTGGSGQIASAYGYGTTGRLPRLGTGLGPQSGGLFAAQGYLSDGFGSNFNASFRHQQGIGSGNNFGFRTELQRSAIYSLVGAQSGNTRQSSRLDFSHADTAHGVSADASLGLDTSSSTGYSTSQITGTYRQSFDFGSRGSTRNNLNYNFNVSRSLSTTTGSLLGGTGAGVTNIDRSARLDSQLQFQHTAREYVLGLQANKTTPIGFQSFNGSFSSLERLPEVTFAADTYNFQSGFLKRIPLRLDLGAGQFSEPSSKINTDRELIGLNLNDFNVFRGRTEMTTTMGFEQRLYGDGAAQYTVRNNTRLRQHLGGRSGFDLNYQYEQPRGGTPFAFDPYGRTHFLTGEGGYLDDTHFQLTARVGYDFLGTSQSRPWQSLSTRVLWRPTPSARFDALATYDPNTSQFFAVTGSAKFRARNDFAVDLYTRYDPRLSKFSAINSQFNVPFGRTWHASGLLQYNGFTKKFDSTNLQLVHEWDCLEASLTYTESPLGFRTDRQFYFSLRIKGLPFFRSFARGPAGQSLSPSLGNLY